MCRGCLEDLQPVGDGCRLCAAPLPGTGICPACQIHPPVQDSAWSALAYQGAARTLVHRFKYRSDLRAGQALAERMLSLLPDHQIHAAGVLVPVPLHGRRLAVRGFNQALEIVHPLAARLQLPIHNGIVERRRNTAPQADLESAKARKRNLKNAFRFRSGQVVPRRVTLVDDVITTGSTASELAACLQAAGVERVQVWSACRSTARRAD